jgi:hypothetical protein
VDHRSSGVEGFQSFWHWGNKEKTGPKSRKENSRKDQDHPSRRTRGKWSTFHRNHQNDRHHSSRRTRGEWSRFRENPKRLWVVDPVGSWSSVQEESGPLISQGGDFGISSSGKTEGRVSWHSSQKSRKEKSRLNKDRPFNDRSGPLIVQGKFQTSGIRRRRGWSCIATS